MHIAQLNIARAKYPLEDLRMTGFVSRVDEINGLGEKSPGFVYRFKDEDGDTTSLRVFPDPQLVINLTVWESMEALKDFTYRTAHAELIRLRKHWFTPMDGPHVVLWWIKNGHTPTLEEARERLEQLEREGPGPMAFDFKNVFSPEQL